MMSPPITASLHPSSLRLVQNRVWCITDVVSFTTQRSAFCTTCCAFYLTTIVRPKYLPEQIKPYPWFQKQKQTDIRMLSSDRHTGNRIPGNSQQTQPDIIRPQEQNDLHLKNVKIECQNMTLTLMMTLNDNMCCSSVVTEEETEASWTACCFSLGMPLTER